MSKKETRKIELDAAAVDALEARAVERGISVSELIVDLLRPDRPDYLENMRQDGRGPWSPRALAEDALASEESQRTRMGVPWEEVDAWMRSWRTPAELPPPKPRKLF
jgi:hypothetical protein